MKDFRFEKFTKERKIQFEGLLNYLSGITDPGYLRSCIQTISSQLEPFALTDTYANNFPAKIDYTSLAILRESDIEYGHLIPLSSLADGNCLFNSISILLGDMSLRFEIKVNFYYYILLAYNSMVTVLQYCDNLMQLLRLKYGRAN